jgi:antitoxin component YwqK of YwqJK toxin-antitoxin module
MITSFATPELPRTIVAILVSVLLIVSPTGSAFYGIPASAVAAPAPASSGQDEYKVVKFVINPRTGQILFGNESNLHVELASGLGSNASRDGYVSGEFRRENGRLTIDFFIGTVDDRALKVRWEGGYLGEYLKQHLSGLPEAQEFHGSEVRVGGTPRGFFDWRKGEGLVTAKPATLAAEQGGSRGPSRVPSSKDSSPWGSGDFFSPQRGRQSAPPPRPDRSEPIRLADPPVAPEATTQAEAESPPGPVSPDLQKRIQDLLKNTDPQQIRADISARRWDFFKKPEFNPPEGPAEAARAWKKVCSLVQFRQHSLALAELRWRMIVDLWAEVAQDHGVRIELIDSGKRNAYRSDIDITIYSPPEGRGRTSIAALIQDFTQRFADACGYGPGNIDVTIHDGDVFIPDIRSAGQRFHEYRSSLRQAVSKMRFKVTSGGDAYYVPGANLETVQKRALREGVVTSLEPQMRARPQPRPEAAAPGEARPGRPKITERAISSLDPNAGRWKVNSSRFEGIAPVYDRRNAFGVLAQNLRQILDHSDNPTDVSKYFNRAMNQGAGAGLVNSFEDIWLAESPGPTSVRGIDLPGDNVIRDAMVWQLERALEPRVWLKYWGYPGRMAMLQKTRWIICAFGVGPDTGHDAIRKIYELLEISTRIEQAKIRGEFNWTDPNRGRSEYMRRYFDEAVENTKKTRPDVWDESAPESVRADAIYAEAWNLHCKALRNVICTAILKNYSEAIADMSPLGLRRNGFRFMTDPSGAVMAETNQEAALKLAEQRRVELALAFEIIHKIEAPVVRDKLIEEIIKKTPEALKAEVEKLSRLTSAELDHFLSESEPPGGGGSVPGGPSREALLREKQRRVGEVAEVSAQEAERLLTNQEGAQRLREHLEQSAALREPGEAFTLQQAISAIDSSFQHTPGEFMGEVKSHLRSPLMLSSSAVNILRAYRTGDPMALRETVMTEMLFYLPTSYGIAGIMIKDFSRGRFFDGLISIGMLGIIHLGSQYVYPGMGELLLVCNVAAGAWQLSYGIIVDKIEDDVIEQAFKSLPDPSAEAGALGPQRARRNPFADSRTFKGDPPAFPLLYDNPCMRAEDHGTSLDVLIEKAGRLFRPLIWKELTEKGLTPSSPNWDAEWNRLARKHGFNIPYYQRMSKIYGCFSNQAAAETLPSGVNEDTILGKIFEKVVQDWFARQPEGYKARFEGLLGSTVARDRFLETLKNQLIGHYKAAELSDLKKEAEKEKIEKEVSEALRQWNVAEMRLLASKDKVLDRIQNGFASWAQQQIASQQPAPARVRLKAPTWYVDFSSHIAGQASGVQTGRQAEKSDPSEPSIEAGELEEAIPVEVIIDASRADFPEPWTHDYRLSLDKIEPGPPPGFTPSDEEKKALEEKDYDGQPKNAVVIVRMAAEATAYDKNGKEIGKSPAVPVVGYVIAAIPHVQGSASVEITAMRPVKGGKKVADSVICKVEMDGKVEKESYKPLMGPPRTVASFDGVREGGHSLALIPLSPDWERATARFDVIDTFSRAAYEAGAGARGNVFPIELTVELKYKSKMPEEDLLQPAGGKPGEAGGAAAAGQGARVSTEAPPGTDSAKECETLMTSLQEAVSSEPGRARSLMDQIRQKCRGRIQGLEDRLRNADESLLERVQRSINSIQTLMGNCEFEEAFRLAADLRSALPEENAVKTWMATNLANLEASARAQNQARNLVRPAREAILARNLDLAVAKLTEALAVPNLPDCMRRQIQPLFEELKARTLFQGLSEQATRASQDCKYDEAAGIAARIEQIKPRYDWISSWLNENVAKLADLRLREQKARALVAQADALAGLLAAGPPAEQGVWNNVITLLEQALDAAPACVERREGIRQKLETARRRQKAPLAVSPGASTQRTLTVHVQDEQARPIAAAKIAVTVQGRREELRARILAGQNLSDAERKELQESAADTGGPAATTSAAGDAQISLAGDGQATITASASGYRSASSSLMADSRESRLTLTLTREGTSREAAVPVAASSCQVLECPIPAGATQVVWPRHLSYELNGWPAGPSLNFYDEAKTRRQDFTCFNRERNQTGAVCEWFENGQLRKEQYYKNGKAEGPIKYYYANGRIGTTGQFKDDQEDGQWLKYTESGILFEEINYLAGERHGMNRKYNSEKGWLYVERPYVHEEVHGTVTFYHSNGKIAGVGPLEHGKSVGTHLVYHEDGWKQQEIVYGRPGVETEWTYFGPDGRWTVKCRATAGQPDCVKPDGSRPR